MTKIKLLTDVLPEQSLEEELHVAVQGNPEHQTNHVVGEVHQADQGEEHFGGGAG